MGKSAVALFLFASSRARAKNNLAAVLFCHKKTAPVQPKLLFHLRAPSACANIGRTLSASPQHQKSS